MYVSDSVFDVEFELHTVEVETNSNTATFFLSVWSLRLIVMNLMGKSTT